MNYDWRYDNINGIDSFWGSFRFRFDDEELIHIRHGDRKAVIMGGDPWSSGGHMESPALAYVQAEGEGRSKSSLRAEPYCEFMEPVAVEVRLRNRSDVPLNGDPRLDTEDGAITFFIQLWVHLCRNFVRSCATWRSRRRWSLQPKSASEGEDRYSQLVSLVMVAMAFTLIVRVSILSERSTRATVTILQLSNVLKIRVGLPEAKGDEKIATSFFSREVGLSLYLGGQNRPS